MADSGDFGGPAAASARPGAGIVSRIRLENFMCRSSLSIELGDWANFITGQNGMAKLDAAAIPAATKADLRAKIPQFEDQPRRAKKKIGEENVQKDVKAATEVAEGAASEGQVFLRQPSRRGIKQVVYAGFPSDRLVVLEWLTTGMEAFKGQGGGGENGVAAQGQGSDASRV